MSLRTRTDRLLEEVGVERTATLNSDVHALAEAVGLDFTSLPATLTALEAEVLGAPAQAAPPAQPAEPAAAPAPAEPAADSDSDGFELTGSQTEAERTAAAREEAERRNAVVDVDDDDDDLAGQSVKTLKAMAAARGVDISRCCEKSEIVELLRAPASAAPRPASPPPAPAAEPTTSYVMHATTSTERECLAKCVLGCSSNRKQVRALAGVTVGVEINQ